MERFKKQVEYGYGQSTEDFSDSESDTSSYGSNSEEACSSDTDSDSECGNTELEEKWKKAFGVSLDTTEEGFTLGRVLTNLKKPSSNRRAAVPSR